MQLRDYQQRAIDDLFLWLSHNEGHPCLELPTGCHARGQTILLYDGSMVPVEDVRIGDMVMGPDSRPRTVLRLCRGVDEMYRITPLRGGEPFVVNGEHVLSLISTREGKRYPGSRTGQEVVNLTVREYLAKSKYWKHVHKLYRTGFSLPQRETPALIPPYILGVLLGDGCLRGNTIMVSTMDPEIDQAVRRWVESYGGKVRKSQSKKSKAWELYLSASQCVQRELSRLGLMGKLSGDKFVPDAYLRNSPQVQAEILAGLLDTDGHMSSSGFDYISKSQQLAGDVVYLARALGMRAHVAQCRKSCQGGFVGTYWRVSISGDCTHLPLRVPHKIPTKNTQKKRSNVSGFSVEHVGSGEYFGFQLDGDHLYLMGDTTVTHNSGKTHLLAEICRRASLFTGTRILVLSHVKELLEQADETLAAHWPNSPHGVYSAGLKRRQLGRPITIAGIQSLRNKFHLLGTIHIIVIDECHLVSHKEQGVYRELIDYLLTLNPRMRVIGLTATPYRLGHGLITDEPAIFSEILKPTSIEELIFKGHLSPLRSKVTTLHYDLTDVHKRGGDYVESELAAAVDTDAQNDTVAREIVQWAGDRRAWLVFCAGIQHAVHMRDSLRAHGVQAELVTGETPDAQRDDILRRFKAGELRCLVNVSVLTTGFNVPHIDLIAMCRPTLSPGLYQQIAGRGLRVAPGKKDCLFLDFAGVVATHGPITAIEAPEVRGGKGGGEAPVKACEQCHELVHTSAKVCPACGAEFPAREEPDLILHDDDIMELETPTMTVDSWAWSAHTSQNSGKQMLKGTYYPKEFDAPALHVYLCLKHEGYAREKAKKELFELERRIGRELDPDADLTVLAQLIQTARPPKRATYKRDGKWWRIIDLKWSTETETENEDAGDWWDGDDVPF